LVVNTKQAFLLNEFYGMGYPSIDDVAVYTSRKSWGLIGEDSYVALDDNWISSSKLDPEYVFADYKGWEKDFVSWDNNISYKDLKENPEEYIFQCDFFEFKELIDIKPENAIYIKSKTEPFNDEMELDKERELKWLNHFNIKVHEGYHASGHACGPEIMEMIREINPESVYPIHTEKKEKFDVLKADGINVLNPKLSI
jgi:ribonuclease J